MTAMTGVLDRRQTDLAGGGIGVLGEVAEEVQGAHSTNGLTSSTNGMDDLMASGGTIDDAASHESLNGAAAHLVFHSDATGERGWHSPCLCVNIR